MGANDAVGLAGQQQLNSQIAHLGCIDTVTAGGNTATLNVAQHRHTGVQINGFLDLGSNIIGRAGAFSYHDHVVGESVETGLADLFNDITLKIDLFLRHQNGGSANSKTHIHSQITGVAAHNLNDRAALVGLHGIPQLIDALDGSIGSSIKADAVIGAADIIIDGTGDTDHIDTILTEGAGATEGAVTADGDDAVQPKEFAGGNSFALTFFGHKFLAAGCVEDGTATIDSMGNALFIQTDNVAGDQTIPAATNTIALNAVIQGSTNNCADAGVHAGSIATAGKNTDSFHTHGKYLLNE